MTFNLEDFTEKNYERILDYAVKRYKFITFKNIKATPNFKDKRELLLWRHDVDFSVHRAFALAKIEKSFGINSTYFILLTGNFYNIFEYEIKKLIFKIIDLGHIIGLHFDPTLYSIKNKNELEYYLNFEKKILESLFGKRVLAFSFHNPTSNIFEFDNFEYAEMINAYAKYYKENFQYCSDSNGYWRFERLKDFLMSNKIGNRYVLTHPAWWQQKIMTPRNRIVRCVIGRANFVMKKYDTLLKSFKRENF